MDRAFGWDFMPPKVDEVKAVGAIRLLNSPSEASILLSSVREALKKAITERNTDYIPEHITRFFAEYPSYHPMHEGRCYPHGHDQSPYINERAEVEAGDCISDGLSNMVNYVLMLVDKGIDPNEIKGRTPVEQPIEPCNCYYDWDCPFSACFHSGPNGQCEYQPNHPNPGKSGIQADGICPQ
ncbi:MAG: hypothetical protein AB8F95_16770 [Bacteroidia bacterium]